jgi:hypothetical protein
MVEHRTHNAPEVGSIPSSLTTERNLMVIVIAVVTLVTVFGLLLRNGL